ASQRRICRPDGVRRHRLRTVPSGDDDPVEGVVSLPVAAGAGPMAGDLPRGGGDRRGRAQGGPRGLGAGPLGGGAGGGQGRGGRVVADAVEGEQAGGAGGYQRDGQRIEALSWPPGNTTRRPSSRRDSRVW